MPIKVIYHACAIAGNAKCIYVIKEHITCMIMSGLYDKAEAIHVNLVGDPSSIRVLQMIFERSGSKFRVTIEEPNGYGQERNTLMNAFQYIHEDDYVLYLHSKGVTRTEFPESMFVDDWTACMNYFLIKRHQDCIDMMEKHNVQVVGINYEPNPKPHFSGNFWWCRGDYFLTLPRFIENDKYAVEVDFLFANNPKYVCVHHTHTHHYQKEYAPSNYV